MIRKLVFIISLVFAVGLFSLPNLTYSSAVDEELELVNPDPECICANARINGSCTGKTERFCQGSSSCKDVCG